ncbi:cubilin [Caerostris extrusa]|uniref:Cubilin n=1 Tax=Caerostris extrusa TaxID=172846 RepID=A0AAV4TW50_CAEEX|nr:cubilin [Caerostris extrusa]
MNCSVQSFIILLCNHEYIDLYMEIDDPSVELIRTPFGGRICGRNIPVSRISMYETLVLAFYTDRTRVTPELFEEPTNS